MAGVLAQFGAQPGDLGVVGGGGAAAAEPLGLQVAGLGAQCGGEVAAGLRAARVEGLGDPHAFDRGDRVREVDHGEALDLALGGEHDRARAVLVVGVARPAAAGAVDRRQARVEDQGEAGELAGGDVDDVARLELLDGFDGGRAALAAALAGEFVLAVLEPAAQVHVLVEVAEVAGHGRAVALQPLLVALHLAGDADDRAVRLELGEGGLQQFARAVPAELGDQVDGHVVGGPEAGLERVRTGAGQAGQRLRVEAALPEHHGVALDVDAAPPGPAGELGVLAGGDVGVGLAVPLDQLLHDHRAGGHVDAERQGLGREDGLDQALHEELLDHFLEPGQHPGVVGGDAALQPVQPLEVAEDVQVLVGDVGAALLDDRADQGAVGVLVEPQPGAEALLDGGLAAGPAEDEGDRGQQALGVEPVDDVDPARGPDPAGAAVGHRAAPAAAEAVAGVAVEFGAGEPDQFGVDGLAGVLQVVLGAAVAVRVREQVVHPVAGHDVLPQRHGAGLGDDHLGTAAHGVQPVAELLGVGDGRGERDEGDRLGEVDDDLLPDGAAEAVGEVVHLVHDDVAEPVEGAGARVEHVAQHLGGHDHHGGVAVDGVVAGEQADLGGAVALDQVSVLLVGQRLDRRGVEALAPGGQGQVHGELADDRLPGAGGGGDQDAGSGFQRLAGLQLEVVQREVVQLLEAVQGGGLLLGPATAGRVRLGGAELLVVLGLWIGGVHRRPGVIGVISHLSERLPGRTDIDSTVFPHLGISSLSGP